MSGFSVNYVTVSGNLTRDPELRGLQNGGSVTSFGVAHNERVKDAAGNWSDRPSFFDITVWGRFGEAICKQLSKGSQVVVAGTLRWRSWEAPDGTKRSAVGIVAHSVIPVPRDPNRSHGGGEAYGPPPDQGGWGGQQQPQAQQQRQQAPNQAPVQPNWSQDAGFGTQQPQQPSPPIPVPNQQPQQPQQPANPIPSGGDDSIPF